MQEYERAVIFRLGRLLDGGSKGPGKCEHTLCFEGLFKAYDIDWILYLMPYFSLIRVATHSGLHFSLPCVESHEVVDMRTITLSVPPQEVRKKYSQNTSTHITHRVTTRLSK